MIVNNLLKTAINFERQLVRHYAFKSDLKIKWVRPEKIPCIRPEKSGDCSKLPPVSTQEFLPDFRNSEELKTADATIQALFQLGNNRNHFTSRHYRLEMIKEVQRHPLDYGSMESKLARMTATIRRFQEHMENFPRDRHIKIMLKETIDKRKKFLKYLRRWDYPRFEWILEKLDLVYKPPPTEFHWITRKESLQKLTDIHCENVKQQRLAEYREQLEAQQMSFLQDAVQKMEHVRREQIDCDVPVTVTQEQISDMKRKLQELKQRIATAEAAQAQAQENDNDYK